MKLTRRAALEKMSAGMLLAAGAWPGVLAAQDSAPSGTFKFIVVNDTHLMSEECARWLEGCLSLMKQQNPAFCLHAGDVTEKAQREHMAMAHDVFQDLGCPVHTTIGNHDYNTPKSNRYYNLFFPRSLNYWFEHQGWQFVGLDTTEGQKYEKTQIQSATLQWLDDHLGKLDRKKPTVIFTHFPLGPGVQYRPQNADALLERFRSYPLKSIFCGHFHGYTEKEVSGTIAYTNRCCALKRTNHDGTKPKGFFVCTAADGVITKEFVEVPPPNVKRAAIRKFIIG